MDVGWLHSEKGNPRKQVKLRKGGGTRKVPFYCSAVKRDIKDEALRLFFPNGMSTKGHIDQMKTVDVVDYSERSVADNISIRDMFNATKLPRLNFYLLTEEKSNSDLVRDYLLTSQSVPAEKVLTSTSDSILGDRPSAHCDAEMIETSCFDSLQSYITVDHDYARDMQITSQSETSKCDAAAINHFAENGLCLRIHRGQAFEEMMTAFQTLESACGRLKIVMIAPNGEEEAAVDAGGVFKDALSEFWDETYKRCTEGTTAKIPILRDDFTAEKWEAMAKILMKGYKDVKYFPLQLCKAFMELCILGDVKSDITDALLSYLSPYETKILAQALQDFDKIELDDLVEVFSSLKSQRIPSRNSLRQVLNDVAHKELIQKPMFVIDIWQVILRGLMTEDDLNNVYRNCVPDCKNILRRLPSEEEVCSGLAERRVFGFLKKYVKEGDAKLLAKLCRFITGADVLTTDSVSVEFNHSAGFCRCFVGHTCTNTLEVPVSYENYQDFRSELTELLESNILRMDIA